METLTRTCEVLDRFVTRIGKIAAWAGVAIVLVTVFDVVSRRFLVLGSTKLQELEWHLHTILFAFCLGYAYIANAHVRIDLVRDRLSNRAKWWLEVAGLLLFLIPYCIVIVYFGADYVWRSFELDESSASATGLPHRWIIKSAIPLGFAVLLLAGIAVLLRKIVELFGPEHLRARLMGEEEAEDAHLNPPIAKDR